MGFFKRLLGLETKPGEPAPLTDAQFEEEIGREGLPCIIYFFHLWCSSCQVMGGLLNEIGPEYADRARFFKLDVTKNPATPQALGVSGVPAVVVFKGGKPADNFKGLMPLDDLKAWLDKNI